MSCGKKIVEILTINLSIKNQQTLKIWFYSYNIRTYQTKYKNFNCAAIISLRTNQDHIFILTMNDKFLRPKTPDNDADQELNTDLPTGEFRRSQSVNDDARGAKNPNYYFSLSPDRTQMGSNQSWTSLPAKPDCACTIIWFFELII